MKHILRSLFLSIVYMLFCLHSALATEPDIKPVHQIINDDSFHFKAGKDYFTYQTPINIEHAPNDKHIDVILFFSYGCHYCSVALDNLTLYQNLHDDIHLQIYPAADKNDLLSSNIYNGLVAIGKKDLAELLIFDSSTNEGKDLFINPQNLYQWLKEHGISTDDFVKILNSPSIIEKSGEAIARTEEFGVITTPFVVINGKYVLTSSTLYDDDYTFAVMDFLISNILNAQDKEQTNTIQGQQ